MIIRIITLFSVLIAAQAFTMRAFATEYARSGGEGHEVPTPFETVNQRFELADGEVYLLYGRILVIPSLNSSRTKRDAEAYFKIDLDRSPWLANSYRVRMPFYRLEGSTTQWSAWNHFPVKLLCRAHARYHVTHEGVQAEISLEPVY